MIFNLLNQIISINLENGVYLWDTDSAVGKSYFYELYNMFKEMDSEFKSKFKYYTFDEDYKLNLDELKGLTNKVIIFDRLDLYESEELAKLIKVLGKQNIILLDLKRSAKYDIGKVKLAIINRTSNTYEVSEI